MGRFPSTLVLVVALVFRITLGLVPLPLSRPPGNAGELTVFFLQETCLFGGDDWSRTSSAFRAADLQSTGVTNFPTSPLFATNRI